MLRFFINKNKDYFTTGRVLIIDQIWCKDLNTAKQAKSALGSGKNFDDVKKEYSLFPDGQAYNAYPGNEGFFWNTLWAGELNNIIGQSPGAVTNPSNANFNNPTYSQINSIGRQWIFEYAEHTQRKSSLHCCPSCWRSSRSDGGGHFLCSKIWQYHAE
jgi:hypothetical protein